MCDYQQLSVPTYVLFFTLLFIFNPMYISLSPYLNANKSKYSVKQL